MEVMNKNFEKWNGHTKRLDLSFTDPVEDLQIEADGVILENAGEAAREISAVKDEVRSINLCCQEGCTSVPAVVGECVNLEELYLCNTPIKELPDFVFRLPKLRVLKYCGFDFEKQPEHIDMAQNLEVLTMYVGEGWRLPAAVFSLKKLTSLTIYGAEGWAEAPGELGGLPRLENLEELDIGDGFRKNAELNVSALGGVSALKKLKKFKLGSLFWGDRVLDFDALAVILAPCPIEELELWNFDVGSGYAKLTLLSRLKTLDFQHIHLDGNFLDAACRLPGLEKLSFCGQTCSISRVPPEIGNLRNLKTISIVGSFFRDIPETFYSLKNLETVALIGCGIRELSADIGNLTELKELRLDDNRLETLPDALFSLPHLKTLELSTNLLSETETKKIQERFPQEEDNLAWQGYHKHFKELQNAQAFPDDGAGLAPREYYALCLKAVEDYGHALSAIDRDRLSAPEYGEVCLAAVKENGFALRYVDRAKLDTELYLSICIKAMKKHADPIRHADIGAFSSEQYKNLCLAVAARNNRPKAFPKLIDDKKLSRADYLDVCRVAIENDHPLTVVYMVDPPPEFWLMAANKSAYVLRKMPDELKTPALCLDCVTRDDSCLEFVPERIKTPEFMRAAAEAIEQQERKRRERWETRRG